MSVRERHHENDDIQRIISIKSKEIARMQELRRAAERTRDQVITE